jgi:hypothetical protein
LLNRLSKDFPVPPPEDVIVALETNEEVWTGCKELSLVSSYVC